MTRPRALAADPSTTDAWPRRTLWYQNARMLQIVASERPKKKTLLDFAHQKVTNANEACASEDWGSNSTAFFAAANALK